MRTGELWGVAKHGIDPGYPGHAQGPVGRRVSHRGGAVERPVGAWLCEDGFGRVSTFGGAELGCLAALKTLEITLRPEVRASVHRIADTVGRDLLDRMATGMARARDAGTSEGVR